MPHRRSLLYTKHILTLLHILSSCTYKTIANSSFSTSSTTFTYHFSPNVYYAPSTGFHLRSPKHFYIVRLFSTRICEPIVQPHIIMQTGLRIVRIDTNVHHKGWPYRGCTTNRGYSCCYICVNKKNSRRPLQKFVTYKDTRLLE